MIRGLRKPPRPKKCPECATMFVRRRAVQPTCGTFKCEEAFAMRRVRKRIAREKYLETLQTQHKAGLLKPIGVLRDDAQVAFRSYVRLRDFDEPCISCGDPNPPRKAFGGAWDAGHYLSRGAHPELAFEPKNCHKQCKNCNSGTRRGGDYVLPAERQATIKTQYRVRLIAKIGQTDVDWLEGPHEPKRYRAEDLIAEKRKWQRAAVELRKARKSEQARAAA